MKTTLDFMADEQHIMNEFAQVLIDMGYKSEWFNNMLGEPTVVVHLVDDDGEKVKYYACFDVASDN